MRALAAFLLIVMLLLAACRDDSERSAMARAPGPASGHELSAASQDQSAAPAVRLRRLWSGSDYNFFASSPSPDGRYVTEIDWASGDLAVRDLVTGLLHRLTDKEGWDVSDDYAEVARFSPDGRRVVYGGYRGVTDTYEVRAMDFTVDEKGVPRGSRPRTVHAGGPQYVFWLYGWTGDNEILVGMYRPDNSTALGFLSLATGSIRVLRSFDWADARAALSPDGTLIAYDHPPGDDRRERDVYLMAADGTGHAPLIEAPGRDRVLGWVPSDGSLLFYSAGAGGPAIRRVAISGGQLSGPPQTVHEGVRNPEPLGFAGEQFYFGHEVDAPKVWTATIDPEEGRLTERTVLHDAGSRPEAPRATAWSPDGDYLVSYFPEGPARARFVLTSAQGTPVKEWGAPLRLKSWMIRWTPDGTALVLSGQDDRGRAGYFRMELATGDLDLIRRHHSFGPNSFTLSPDGRSLYYTRAASGAEDSAAKFVEIVDHDLAAGAERVIHQVTDQDRPGLGASHWSPLAVTPDGATMVYPEIASDRQATLWLLSLSGGERRQFYRVGPPGLHEIVGWDAEGSHLYILVGADGATEASPDEGSPDERTWATADIELLRISRRTGEAQRLGLIRDYVGGASLHPDGRALAFRSGRPRGEIWALELDGERASAEEGVRP